MNVKSECEIRPGMREQEIERDQCIPAACGIFTLFSVLLLHTGWPQSVHTMDCVYFS